MIVHDVEKLLGVSKQTLFYYEREGFVCPQRSPNGYRDYQQEDIDKIKFIQTMRSFEISIKDIHLILNNQLSINDALQMKKEFISDIKMELDNIDNKIKDFIKRRKVKISFSKEQYDQLCPDNILYFNQNEIIFCEEKIMLNEIISINISMCSTRGDEGLSFKVLTYYIDLDIYLQKTRYSFQIINNNKILKMFDYFVYHQIEMRDPLNLNSLYHQIVDPVMLNKYINQHFREWAKEYKLDNPRANYYTLRREYYIDPLNDIKMSKNQTTVKQEVITFFNLYKDMFINLIKKLKKLLRM